MPSRCTSLHKIRYGVKNCREDALSKQMSLRRHTEINGSSSLRLDGIIPLTMKGISDASPSRAHASADICLFSLPASCLKDAISLSSYLRGYL